MKSLKVSSIICVLSLLVLNLSGCGYSAGTLNRTGVEKLYIPVFKNNVYEPNLGVLVTGTVVKNFQTDGSIKITNEQDADAVLKGTIVEFRLSPARFRVENEKSVQEYFLTMAVDYQLVRRGETKEATSGRVTATTSFFTGDDLINDKRQGVSYVAEKIGRELATRLSESW